MKARNVKKTENESLRKGILGRRKKEYKSRLMREGILKWRKEHKSKEWWVKIETIEEGMCRMIEMVMSADAHKQRWQFSDVEANIVNERLDKVVWMWEFLGEYLYEGSKYYGRDNQSGRGSISIYDMEVKVRGEEHEVIMRELSLGLEIEILMVLHELSRGKVDGWYKGKWWHEGGYLGD